MATNVQFFTLIRPDFELLSKKLSQKTVGPAREDDNFSRFDATAVAPKLPRGKNPSLITRINCGRKFIDLVEFLTVD